MLNRRDFIRLAGFAGVTMAVPGCSWRIRPIASEAWKPLPENPLPFAGLACSLPEEHDYQSGIEGQLPPELRGTLYRNGPGLFDRGKFRKCMILDGDGMIQAFQFHNGGVRYRNRFVRTKKYLEEEAAGKYLYATFATPAPGGPLANLGIYPENQAAVTVIRRDNTLWAFDEMNLPYKLEAETLETIGMTDLGVTDAKAGFQAHWKLDGHNGDWLHFGIGYGRRNFLEVRAFRRDGTLRNQFTVPVPRFVYMHDWLVSDRHVIFIMHPGVISMTGVLKMVLGLGTPAGTLRWKPELGNIVIVVDREGREKPIFLEADAAWVWHCLNAYEENGIIIGDFCGSAGAVGIGSEQAPLFKMMEGELPEIADLEAAAPHLRRYVIDPAAKSIREEILADEDVYEMPFVNQRFVCHRHRYGYLARGGQAEGFWSSVARIDTQTGKIETYDFGKCNYCTEPVFIPKPGFAYEAGSAREPGWLLTLVYCDHTKRSYLAVLQADHLSAGPVALVHLHHHAPLSFHGFWYPQA
jgi:all-trans-8'-apo-beta-carotenal 15,15'-oxygenase